MNEEIEYAEMLEIPVSTVNVIRKNERRRKKKSIPNEESAPLKETVIDRINERIEGQEAKFPLMRNSLRRARIVKGNSTLTPFPIVSTP